MKLSDVWKHPLYEELEAVVPYGKRNFGVLVHPNYYGQETPKPEKLSKAWTRFRQDVIMQMRMDNIDAARNLIKQADGRCVRYHYQHEPILYFIYNNYHRGY